MIKTIPSISKLLTLARCFSTDLSRLKYIRTHTPMNQYEGLNSQKKQHLPTSIKLHQDPETGIRFLVEEGGFPGCADLGICLKLGVQDQSPQQSGSLSYLKSFVHMKPTFEELISNYEFLQQTGSFFDFNYDPVTSYAKCSFLQGDKDIMIDLLLDLVLQQKNMFEDNFQTQQDLSNISELVRRTAFGHKGLGMASQGNGNILKNQNFLNFQQKIVPSQTIISMANIQNSEKIIQEILHRIKTRYPKYLKRKAPQQVKSVYQGGLGIYHPPEPEFFSYAVAFPSAEFKSRNMELFNILRVLLGSASSFSSGGPGKGMHSRCTKYLLNRVACVESATFINDHFEDFGLFGLSVSGPHDQYNEVIRCTLNEMNKLKHTIPEQQLNRAKSILISSLYTNTERQADRLQQMTKHIFSYGQMKLYKFEQRIREITASQIQEVMVNMMKQKPTFVYSGIQKSTKSAPNESKLLQIAKFA